MGSDVADWLETLPSSIKVHSTICLQLRDLVCRIRKIFSNIEAARPGCSSGMEALCSLTYALERAKKILQHDADSSKFYRAITADRVLLRCQRAKNSLEESLCQIQNMVPVMLAVEIYQITEDLRSVVFSLDPSEEEAGRVVLEMLQKTASVSSVEDFEVKALQFAAEKLKITSFEAMETERISLKRLLDETGDSHHNKAKILKYLLNRMRKYGNRIITEREEKSSPEVEATFAERNSCNSSVCAQSASIESRGEIDALGRPIPPDYFWCPLSHVLMYDPVVIASGQTYERVWIQKWFEEGNATCPKSQVKLDHLLLTPNTTLKNLILKWCLKNEIATRRSTLLEASSLDLSTASIASFGSSVYDLCLRMDASSIGASDASSGFETSELKTSKASILTRMERIDSDTCHSDSSPDDSDSELLCKLPDLPWSSQQKVVEDARTRVKHANGASQFVSAETFIKPLIHFLISALDFQDFEALRAGSELLFDCLEKKRIVTESLSEDVFCLLSKLLGSEAAKEALNIIKLLSRHPHCRSKIISSGALSSILKIFDDQIEFLQEQAVIILRNLFTSAEICPTMASLQCIPRLTPFLHNIVISRHALIIFRHLCENETGRHLLTETSGCISSLCELLESGTEEQEHVVCILLSLCSRSPQCSRLVMKEGLNVYTSLSYISINGNMNAKVRTFELLRNLNDVDYYNDRESVVPDPVVPDAAKAVTVPTASRPSSKPSRFFGVKLPYLSRKKGNAF